MSHYKKHVFLCTNQKVDGKKCCAAASSEQMKAYLKQRLIEADQHGAGKVRVSTSGCMGRCGKGPCLVVYPEGTWYTYKNEMDIDAICDQHLLKDQPVETLFME